MRCTQEGEEIFFFGIFLKRFFCISKMTVHRHTCPERPDNGYHWTTGGVRTLERMFTNTCTDNKEFIRCVHFRAFPISQSPPVMFPKRAEIPEHSGDWTDGIKPSDWLLYFPVSQENKRAHGMIRSDRIGGNMSSFTSSYENAAFPWQPPSKITASVYSELFTETTTMGAGRGGG